MNQIKVYISGPYSSLPAKGEYNSISTSSNIYLARREALKWWNAGYGVFCPHTNTMNFDTLAPEVPYENYLEYDLSIIPCHDVVVFLERWEDSNGSLKEHTKAATCSKVLLIKKADSYMIYKDGYLTTVDEVPSPAKLVDILREHERTI